MISTQEISGAYGISKHHLVRVVHTLAEHQYVNIQAGRSGGVVLARAPHLIPFGRCDSLCRTEPPAGRMLRQRIQHVPDRGSVCAENHAQRGVASIPDYTEPVHGRRHSSRRSSGEARYAVRCLDPPFEPSLLLASTTTLNVCWTAVRNKCSPEKPYLYLQGIFKSGKGIHTRK